MSQNIYCKPVLKIDDVEIQHLESVKFTDTGNNQLQKLSATITEPDLENFSLFNAKVEFYLNYGSSDGCPIFRGFVKDFNPSGTNITINALDVRTLISGDNSFPVVIDDKKNYDGQTVTAFLLDVLNQINNDLIKSTTLNDIDKPVFMTGVRVTSSPYDIASSALKRAIDDDDILKPRSYEFDVVHLEQHSSLKIIKQKQLSEAPSQHYSYNDGIISCTYKDRVSPSFALTETVNGEQVIFELGNAPKGKIGLRVSGSFNSRGEAKEALIPQLIAVQDTEKDISIRVSKGFYTNIGDLLKINVDDDNLNGQYRVTSKNITFAKQNVQCTLQLNKKPIIVSDYILAA
tara:strand:+ start:501 stop:1538 length:1038 start_codon:yes stop_codon:yes gene_type:complete